MTVFGSELRFHPKLEHAKLGILIQIAKLYLLMFGVFGILGGGEYLRSLYFRKMLNKYKFKFNSVLDAGCGHGYYSFYLARKYPNVIIDACDLDGDIINENKYIQNQSKTTNINFFQLDLGKMFELNLTLSEYDFIFSIDVLEHIENDEKVIKNICNTLKRGGYLLIHTPQKDQRHIFNSTPVHWKEECPDHAREGYSVNEMSQLLERNGFDIIEKINTFSIFGEISYRMHLLVSTRQSQKIFAVPINCISWLDTVTRHKKGNGLLIIAKKKVTLKLFPDECGRPT